MNIKSLEKLARRVVGREVPVGFGPGAYTDGTTVTVPDPEKSHPNLPHVANKDVTRHLTAHEAVHILLFDRIAKKVGKSSVSAVEFYEMFADPLSPGESSKAFVRFMMNVVEDKLVDNTAGQFVGADTVERSNKFAVWNRQGGRRKPIPELESDGKSGQCAAFIEAIFQLEIYGELIEAFVSPQLEASAKEAVKAIEAFGKSSLSRTQALSAVLDALRKYCKPEWSLPPQYQPPRGEGAGEGGDPAAQPGEGAGQGAGEGSSDSDDDGEGSGESQDESSESAEGDGTEGECSDGDADGSTNKESDEEELGSESDDSRNDSPSDGNERGSATGDKAGDGRKVASSSERRFDDSNLEALLKMLERVVAERMAETGKGLPRFRAWEPGRPISSPDEIHRYQEDETFGIDPLKRRCVRRRDQEKHLIALFIDSSGSVNDQLFSKLYQVCGEFAEKVANTSIRFGVGQFSGGAAWVLEPTQDVSEIQEFAQQVPKRLYSGGTTVGEIYQLLPEDFAGYKSADLIVLTDGYVEDGKELAKSLDAAHEETDCEIKLHGVVFRKMGSLKQFRKAKDSLPEFVRTWHLGSDE